MSTLGGSGVREGVGDLQEEESGGDKADGVGLKKDKRKNFRRTLKLTKIIQNRFIAYLPDPALLNVELEGELGEHGSQGVGVSHLGHRESI